jgi:ParB-like chromosome segregation protein Spo0J
VLTVEVDEVNEVDEAPQPYKGLEASVVHTVSVADLSVGYSPRQMKVDHDHVAALADVVDRLPPVVVDERTMTVIDGVHRVEAYRKLGRSRIPALMFRGNDMEALVIAIQANIQHGKPLNRGERQEAARALLHECPERSDRWVGEVCGVSHTTVAVLRRSVSAADAKVRMGRDGRRRPVDPSLGQAAVARVMAENPTASIRQAAGAAGVAPSTVQRLAAGLARSQKPPLPGIAFTLRATVEGPHDDRPHDDRPHDDRPHDDRPHDDRPHDDRPVSDLVADPVSHPSGEGAEVTTWLARTSVSVEDLYAHLASLPLSRVYEVADECRRRARSWAQMADALEARVRRGSTAT